MTKSWPQRTAKPYNPVTWEADPTKWEKWNRDRIEATFESLAAEAATLPLAEATVLKLGQELQDLKQEFERTLHELKGATATIRELDRVQAKRVEQLTQLQGDLAVAQAQLKAVNACCESNEEEMEELDEEITALKASNLALTQGMWDLREACKDESAVRKAGDVLQQHRARGK